MSTSGRDVLAAHRLTMWHVYPWKGGHEVAPRCTCGVLWSAGKRDDLDAQTGLWEAHLAAVFEAEVIRPREAEAAARALEDAADHSEPGMRGPRISRDWLRARATGLRAGVEK